MVIDVSLHCLETCTHAGLQYMVSGRNLEKRDRGPFTTVLINADGNEPRARGK